MLTSDGALAQKPILSGPLTKLDIKPAQIDTAKGAAKRTLTVAMHFALARAGSIRSNTPTRSRNRCTTTSFTTP